MSKQLLQSFIDSCKCSFTLDKYQLIPYNIKLTHPWNSASQSMHFRQGLLLRLVTQQGLIGMGDCAPLPEMGTETLLQAQQQLAKALNKTLDKKQPYPIAGTWLNGLKQYPASRFALESAILDLVCQYKKQHLTQLLNPQAGTEFRVNAMLGDINLQTPASIKKAENQGFGCLKFKLGLQAINKEAAHLKTLLKHLKPDTKIRLDCNKSWNLQQSQWFLDFINAELKAHIQQIDSIEEPLSQYNTKQYQLLQAQTPVSLALDESLSEIVNLEHLPVQRIILKPTITGGIINSWQLAQKAQSLSIEVIITSAIETAYGLWPVSALAAALDNDLFHGLATADWLENTLIEAPEIKHGTITL